MAMLLIYKARENFRKTEFAQVPITLFKVM